ncbi:DUF2630 family protein [Streptomyces sp. NPDC048514]|uniref:DUF2630 family protein n=1 Tax=Streptomyces sp. NPDC048514 TaxID=3365564 RepID=UPI003717ACA0
MRGACSELPSVWGDAGDRLRRTARAHEPDGCWNLLRQRRAKAESGDHPDQAKERPSSQVEGYRG